MILLALIACGPEAEQSPLSLEELTQAAVTDFWSEEEEQHIADLSVWMADNVDAEVDGYYFSALPEEVVADIEHDPDINWDECLGAGVVMRVDGTMADYVPAQAEADQTFTDGSYSEWSRCSISGSADEFVAGGDWSTDNHVVKSELTITIPYDMYKDFRWFGDTLVGFTWVPHAGYDDAGDNGIVAGFTIEIWYEDDQGVVWYNGQWSDLKTLLDDYMADHPETALDLLITGTQEYMEGTEAHVLAGGYATPAGPCD